MKQLTFIQPYSDSKLKFNETTGYYELTKEYCNDQFGSCYGSDGTLISRIKLNSRVVYNFIRLHVATVNRPVVEFLLKRTKEGREFILELLSAQQYADIQTGYNDLLYQPAVNFNGQDKDRAAIKQNSLCVAAEQVFDTSDSYFGIRLNYQGQFPPQLFLLARTNP